jgi:hypothetical protein
MPNRRRKIRSFTLDPLVIENLKSESLESGIPQSKLLDRSFNLYLKSKKRVII